MTHPRPRSGLLNGFFANWHLSRRFAAGLWVLLASICVHALLPIGSPLLRSSGSPFSAATVEVSIGPKRTVDSEVDILVEDTGPTDRGLGIDPPGALPPLNADLEQEASSSSERGFVRRIAVAPARSYSSPPPARAPPYA